MNDLDWLARNLHKWNGGYEFCVVETGKDGELYHRFPSVCINGITKREWLARRHELQNKPSWLDAPEWASWLGQDEGGKWEWYEDDKVPPTCDAGYWNHKYRGQSAKRRGEVIGSWRDTLEKRPYMFEIVPEIGTSQEHVQKSAESMHFEPFISVEDAVNHPSHYASGEIECIEAIKASLTPEAFRGYLKGNVTKYIWRYEKKLNPAQDLEKAAWYLSRLIKEL